MSINAAKRRERSDDLSTGTEHLAALEQTLSEHVPAVLPETRPAEMQQLAQLADNIDTQTPSSHLIASEAERIMSQVHAYVQQQLSDLKTKIALMEKRLQHSRTNASAAIRTMVTDAENVMKLAGMLDSQLEQLNGSIDQVNGNGSTNGHPN